MKKNTLSDRGETQNIITFVGLYGRNPDSYRIRC